MVEATAAVVVAAVVVDVNVDVDVGGTPAVAVVVAVAAAVGVFAEVDAVVDVDVDVDVDIDDDVGADVDVDFDGDVARGGQTSRDDALGLSKVTELRRSGPVAGARPCDRDGLFDGSEEEEKDEEAMEEVLLINSSSVKWVLQDLLLPVDVISLSVGLMANSEGGTGYHSIYRAKLPISFMKTSGRRRSSTNKADTMLLAGRHNQHKPGG